MAPRLIGGEHSLMEYDWHWLVAAYNGPAMNLPVFSRYVRRIHMYLALYLTPWVLMYAASSIVFNHMGTIRGWYGNDLNQFEKVSEQDYRAPFSSNLSPAEAARQILLDLDMDGAHFVRGDLNGERFTVMRQSPYALRRITYFPEESRLLVERQVPNLPSILTRMHGRHGYEQDYASTRIWGLGVELTVLAMLFWIASGLWLWWEIKPARRWGAVFLLGGLGCFALLLLVN